MKKITKKSLIFLLIFSLLFSSVGVYAFYTRFSFSGEYYKELKQDFCGTLKANSVYEYYFSKVPTDFVVKTDPVELKLNVNVMHGKYLGKTHRSNGEEFFYFINKGFLEKDKTASKLMFVRCGWGNFISIYRGENDSYFCSPITYMFNYYGIEFEVGKEYLVFFVGSRYGFGSQYVYAPLDGEYPYIEVYPGATRYDATYFGAESKDVSKEEFIELVSGKVNEANKDVLSFW